MLGRVLRGSAGAVIVSLGLLTGLLLSGATRREEATGFQWRRDASAVALVRGGEVVWQFQYAAALTKPMFHPVSLPAGPVLTADAPGDHRWHHGFWFAWKYINGLNYWEERPGEPHGLTTWRNVSVATRPDYSARIRLNVDYHPPDSPALLQERREITVSAPDREGQYHFDWQSTFTAGGAPVRLDRTPIVGEPKGMSWGGYAGLSWRFAQDLAQWQVAFLNGDTALEPTGRRAAALEVNGMARGAEAGVAFLDHPDNLNSPSPWHLVAQTRNSFLFAQPAVLYYGPHTLAANKSLVLRYRVIVHPGRWDASRLKQALADFTTGDKR
jgi:hypothetical protein